MHDVHPDRAPPVPEPRRPRIIRRLFAVASGLVSLALIFLMAGLYGDRAELGVLWVFIVPLLFAFGAGAAVLWYPKDRPGPQRRTLLLAVALVIVAAGVFLVLVTD